MATRKRIDWAVILEPGRFAPEWGKAQAPSALVSLIVACDELFKLSDPDALLKRAVELSISQIGLVRAGLYLFDEASDLMLGTWGTNLKREVVDEHHAKFDAGVNGHRVFERALSGEAYWTVVEDCPIIDLSAQSTQVAGRGWVVCTPIRSAQRVYGALYNDAGLTGAKVDPDKQLRAAVLCTLLGSLLDGSRHSARLVNSLARTAKHSTVAKIQRLLSNDPSLSGKDMAVDCNISLSRLARLFKAEMGLSLVDYRNRLRLERFLGRVNAGGTNLLEAALASGFGSYAQFHRVFRATYGKSPREYLGVSG